MCAAIKVLFLTIVLINSSGWAAGGGSKGLSAQTQRAIKEAENLSLLKDRLPACTALTRTIKKANKEEAKILREKLGQLSKYFYTDKGFQDYLLGKELFEKQKFQDALDKFTEADEFENGNIEVLHFLELSQLWLKKTDLALGTNKRALQLNPYDIEILRDQLSINLYVESWEDALKVGQSLMQDFGDNTPPTYYGYGLALWHTGMKDQGEKFLNQAFARDATLPELNYWLAKIQTGPDSRKLVSRYLELCNIKTPKFIERDPNNCLHILEVQKLSKTVETSKKDRL